MLTFNRLKTSSFEPTGSPGAIDNLTPDDLFKMVVVRASDQQSNVFYRFENVEAVFKFIVAEHNQGRLRALHEIASAQLPQHMRFDFDRSSVPWDEGHERAPTIDEPAMQVVNGFINALHDANLNSISFNKKDFAVFDSSGLVFPPKVPLNEQQVLQTRCLAEGFTPEIKAELTRYRCGWKTSFHIIYFGGSFDFSTLTKMFHLAYNNHLNPQVRQFIDTQVYHQNNQSFRLPWGIKENTVRMKRLVSLRGETLAPEELDFPEAGYHGRVPLSKLLVQARGLTQLLFMNGEIAKSLEPSEEMTGVRNVSLNNAPDLVKDADRLARGQGLLDVMVFRDATDRGGTFFINYDRTGPSHCRLCNRTHENDNTIYLRAVSKTGQVYLHCRHNTNAERKSIHVGCVHVAVTNLESKDLATIAKTGTVPVEAKLNLVQREIAAIAGFTPQTLDEGNDLLQPGLFNSVEVYDDPEMRDLDLTNHPTTCVRANMGVGKTKALGREYIKIGKYENAFCPTTIVMVTFRMTFAEKIRDDFKDHFGGNSFKLYSETEKGYINSATTPKIICQAESLWRLYEITPPELTVIDEAESVFSQMSSQLGRQGKTTESWSVLELLIKHSHRLVLMDANLSRRTLDLVRKIRAGQPIHLHWNRHLKAENDSYYFTQDQGLWYSKLVHAIKTGKKVCVPTNSVKEARKIYETVNKHKLLPEHKIKLYSSDTSQKEKREDFKNVNDCWTQFDLLIYTPTVTAGVSFTLAHYDLVFPYCVSTSCDVEAMRQMMGRVRCVNERKYIVFIKAQVRGLPETYETVKEGVYNNRLIAGRLLAQAGLGDTESAGHARYLRNLTRHLEHPHMMLQMYNIMFENLSLNNYAKRMVRQIRSTGASIYMLEAEDPLPNALSTPEEMRRVFNATAKELREHERKQIAEAPIIDGKVAEEIEVRMSAEEATPEEEWALKGYRLRRQYRNHNWVLTPELVGKLHASGLSTVHRNLSFLGDLFKTRAQIHRPSLSCMVELLYNEAQKESKKYAEKLFALDGGRTFLDPIQTGRTVQELFMTTMLLIRLGFSSIWDTRVIPNDFIRSICDDHETIEVAKILATAFKDHRASETIRKSKQSNEKYVVDLLNSKLESLFGVKLVPHQLNGMCITATETYKFIDLVNVETEPSPNAPKPIVFIPADNLGPLESCLGAVDVNTMRVFWISLVRSLREQALLDE